MKNEIEVSVIMPTYNASRYIEEAIESVYCQKVNWELIIIDDASDDDTEHIVQKFLEDERVVYIKNKEKTRYSFINLLYSEYNGQKVNTLLFWTQMTAGQRGN